MAIKGKLIIIGGAEDKGRPQDIPKNAGDTDTAVDEYYEKGILHRIVKESAKKNRSRIEIVTTASTQPEQIGKDYTEAFHRLNANNTGVLIIESREQAGDAKNIERLQKADVVMVTGGDQLRLTSILGGTPFLNLLQEKYLNEDFIYAGSSAGAAAASNNMVFKGSSDLALYKGKVRLTSGLGMINDVVVDTHFITRGRIGRLLQAVVANPRIIGIGLEENAALMVTNGTKMEAIGPGMSIIVDGRSILDSNFNDIVDGQSISIENVTLHVMSKYDIYHLDRFKLNIDHSNNRAE
ncbi:cyanophycinase [Flavobacterium sp.]|uniref:cyanophycinase n=1 Tax=Flavobacterium sp. TaxID=239 RepID=UPI002616095F|nr:cyanophycinase [Flavobacterium sp.]